MSGSGKEGCPVLILRTRGVLQMRTSTLFSAKNFGFFKTYGVSVEPVRTFFGQGGERGGQFFEIFCGRPLCTDPSFINELV